MNVLSLNEKYQGGGLSLNAAFDYIMFCFFDVHKLKYPIFYPSQEMDPDEYKYLYFKLYPTKPGYVLPNGQIICLNLERIDIYKYYLPREPISWYLFPNPPLELDAIGLSLYHN